MNRLKKAEKEAASKAINKTIRMLEKKFGITTRGRTPTERRKKIITKIGKKFDKLNKKYEKMKNETTN